MVTIRRQAKNLWHFLWKLIFSLIAPLNAINLLFHQILLIFYTNIDIVMNWMKKASFSIQQLEIDSVFFFLVKEKKINFT